MTSTLAFPFAAHTAAAARVNASAVNRRAPHTCRAALPARAPLRVVRAVVDGVGETETASASDAAADGGETASTSDSTGDSMNDTTIDLDLPTEEARKTLQFDKVVIGQEGPVIFVTGVAIGTVWYRYHTELSGKVTISSGVVFGNVTIPTCMILKGVLW